MIEIFALRYRYPGADAYALDGINLDVAEGAFLVVAGPSGGGKTTLAHALTGVVPHLSGGAFGGFVRIGGRDTRRHRPRDLADVVALVPQDATTASVTDQVEDEVVFAMENLGVEPVAMRKRLEEVLDALGIDGLRERPLATLSGGERQRVAIAAVLAAQPQCLVLDEPTSQLDPQSAEDVLAVLHRLNTDLGLTLVCVEHRLDRVAQHADRMLVLDGGRPVAEGGPREVLERGAARTPLSRLAHALGWRPVPLTVREGRAFAARHARAPFAPEPAPAPGDELVRARGLRVALGGREVLADVDLSVGRGETVAIVGRNGSGKTTLLRTVLGLLRPHAGERRIVGLDPGTVGLEAVAVRVAYVPQSSDTILFRRTVRDEIAFTLAARAPRADVSRILGEAGLADLADADPRELSAGQRLRVALCAATAGDPDVVLLDEPTRGMDEAAKDALVETLRAWRSAGRAVLLVTHDVELVARAATRVLMLAQGRVVLDGPAADVLGDSPLFSSQVSKVFGDRGIRTVEDALLAVGAR